MGNKERDSVFNPAETNKSESMDVFDLSQVEKSHILRVLGHFQGNKTRAANAMGITVKTLYNKLARYNQERNLGQ